MTEPPRITMKNAGEVERLWQQRADTLAPKEGLQHTGRTILQLLRAHSPETHLHSKRVALLATELLEGEGASDLKGVFWGGSLHDTGKLLHASELFQGRDITADEYRALQAHARQGFEALKGQHAFVALMAGMHHIEKAHGYGVLPDAAGLPFSPKTERLLHDTASAIAIAAFVDAYLSRPTIIKDEKLQGKSLRQMLHEAYPGHRDRVERALQSPLLDVFYDKKP